MCGIVGFFTSTQQQQYAAGLNKAIKALSKRGPDAQLCLQLSDKVGFGHARLSVIDTSSVANQPMTDASGRYTIIFNGEIFNYRELREQYIPEIPLLTHSDTEVLLYLYIQYGKECLHFLNGFFAFAVFDKVTEEIFLARDRYGIKPLYIYARDQHIIFASELKAILQFPIEREIDFQSLAIYLQLNYLPGNKSMLKHLAKLLPGYYAIISAEGTLQSEQYYKVPFCPGERIEQSEQDYDQKKAQLRKLVEEAVQRRLVSDVPLGTFLSGGIDSSIVTYCASQNVKHLNTFSIGFKDEPFFDETKYANLVAKKFQTNHTVFSISNDDMFGCIYEVLDYMDEPFADSSAIAVYLLSNYTKQKVTVALSGDGGDELFAGYNKHKAEYLIRQNTNFNKLIKAGLPLFKLLPQSRHSKWTNLFRQLERFSEGMYLSPSERYWRWCAFQSDTEALSMFAHPEQVNRSNLANFKELMCGFIREHGDLNDVLLADLNMVLPGDMLTKVDSMSMANSLEVRVPLLDYAVVDFAFSLPVSFKIKEGNGKRILKDAFADVLPSELFNRPKKGFEVPLLKWLQTELREMIENDLLEDGFIKEQDIFCPESIRKIKEKVFSNNPGDAHAIVWSLVVFQHWYKRYMAG